MRKNGFTLIELLAVIVILAIIALIATPIILGIINDAREKANERSVELYASAVRNGIAAYQLREGKEVLPGTYNETNKLPFEVEYDGKVDCTNIIISEDGKVSLDKCTVNGGTKEYSYGINQGSNIAKACTLDDKDSDGVASLSDVITCGTESFYVMYNENNEITMLSMYNLYVGYSYNDDTDLKGELPLLENATNKQNEIAKGYVSGDSNYYGVVIFSDSLYWGNEEFAFVYNENSNLYQYVSEYEKILKEDFKVSSAKATLISYQQLVDLETNKGNPSWLYSTSYWSGSARNNEPDIYAIHANDRWSKTTYDDLGCGVRPVITISTSEIQ